MKHSEISSLREAGLPVVAIIGRPNVGKSTLFNRLMRKKRMITDPTPGVTRDPVAQKWYIDGSAVLLVDTGGVKLDKEGLDYIVTKKSLELLEIADAIIFLLDCTEVTSEDEMLMQELRPFSDKVIVTVNKIDDPSRESLIWDFYSYGYKKVMGISSAHGVGIGDLEDELYEMLNLEFAADEIEIPSVVNIAVLGKPNTGKSTLTNLFTQRETSIVSDIPGTTRDVVSADFTYKDQKFTILDTAGIRRKSKVDEDVEYYSVNRAIKTIDEADVILLMVDITEGIVEQDKKIAQLIVRKGKGVILVFNKVDLLTPTVGNQIEAITDRARFLFPILSFAPIVPISALQESSVSLILEEVLRVWKQLNKRVGTSTLNEHLSLWQQSYEVPRSPRGHVKIYYGTQVSAPPIRFLLFVNRKKDFPQTYLQYIKNNIRRDLGFSSVPVMVELKERERNPYGKKS
ncbi:MAG: ribosome biogenesis GTPase Der [Sphaerochaetaceae bacterium]